MNDNAPAVRFALPHEPESAQPRRTTPEPWDFHDEVIVAELYREEIIADLYAQAYAGLFNAEPDPDYISYDRVVQLEYQARCIVEDIIANTPPWELHYAVR